jgi:tripartite-type tricarboxylate transporter receptor subunit TctC
MTFPVHHICALSLVALSWGALIAESHAQTFPVRPIRVIVSAPSGAGQDVEARQLTPHISTELGVPVVVENRPGGAGLLGLEVVTKATADGYTLGAATIGNYASHPRLFDRPAYNVGRDLAAVSLSIRHPWVLYVNAAVPAQTFQQFITLAKAKPESITYASPGVGSFTQLTASLLQTMTGTRLRHIPYGAQPWQPDLLGGHVNASLWPLITMVDHVKAGRLRALAISNGKERSPQVPDVPLFSEVGVQQFDPSAWAGLVVPAGTPKPVVERLALAAARAAQTSQYREFAAKIGATAVGSMPAEFDTFAKAERTRWKKVITDNGIKLE